MINWYYALTKCVMGSEKGKGKKGKGNKQWSIILLI